MTERRAHWDDEVHTGLLYEAWGLIANAYLAPLNWHGDDLTDQQREWVAAAEQWRDRWHATIRALDSTDE